MGRLPVFIRECDFPAVLVSRLQTFLYVQASEFCSSPRSLLPLRVFPQSSRDLLRPGISCFVTSARSGYAIRPIQAIDGKRTFTFQDLQPCRLLQCLTNRTVNRIPAPATSHVACGFPALRAPAHFTSKFMRPIRPERLPSLLPEYFSLINRSALASAGTASPYDRRRATLGS